MARIEVPDSIADQVKELIEHEQAKEAKLARIDELRAAIDPLQRELTTLLREVEGPARPAAGRGRRANGSAARTGRGGGGGARVDEAAVYDAIKAGATNGSAIAQSLGISSATANLKIKQLIASGQVRAEGQRRGRRLIAT
jgi:hypothetical protein